MLLPVPARERKVSWLVAATLAACHDVLNLEQLSVVLLRDPAVFTAVGRTRANEMGHLVIHYESECSFLERARALTRRRAITSIAST